MSAIRSYLLVGVITTLGMLVVLTLSLVFAVVDVARHVCDCGGSVCVIVCTVLLDRPGSSRTLSLLAILAVFPSLP